MRKLMTAGGALTSLLAGAIVWFVLYVILGVTLWVSFVAGGVVAVGGVIVMAPLLAGRKSHEAGSAGRNRPGTAVGAR